MSGVLRIAVRVFVIGKLHSEEIIEATKEELSGIMPRLAAKHAELSAAEPTMIELEFLDDPSNDRFFRIGTDPNAMVMPMAIDLRKPN